MTMWRTGIVVAGLLVLVAGCARGPSSRFAILSGSENETLVPIVERFCRERGYTLDVTYKGSVDIMLELQKPEIAFDAVWPAHSLWIAIGDSTRRVKHATSVMTSPVVFGIRKSLAEQLGFTGRDVRVADILAAVRAGKLRFIMTSATQSNSGASAYLGFLYALLGNPDVLTMEHLRDPKLREDIRTLLSGVDRSSGSSGWLKDLYLKGRYDAMVNYEALIMETNAELVRAGREPMVAVYPTDGIVLADSPLGFVSHGDSRKEAFFRALQAHLLSDEAQSLIAKHGRRTGFGGVVKNPDPAVFNPDWGIQPNRILSPIRLPSPDVIMEALGLYQAQFRKPSHTVFCLDFSGSMKGDGVDQVRAAMDLLLDDARSRTFMINMTADDLVDVIPFSGSPVGRFTVAGGKPDEARNLARTIRELQPDGGTDIYSPVIEALALLATDERGKRVPAVVLMTDGESNTGRTFEDLRTGWQRVGLDIPVFCIMFGKASENQLRGIADLSRGQVFDGRKDLVAAFRKVKGYN